MKQDAVDDCVCFAAGCEKTLVEFAIPWMEVLVTGPHEYPSIVPCLPTRMAFQKLLNNALHCSQWDLAASTALVCASLYPAAAQDGLRAALTGASKLDWVSSLLREDGTSSDIELPEWLYGFWFERYSKKGDVSVPHSTIASSSHFKTTA